MHREADRGSRVGRARYFRIHAHQGFEALMAAVEVVDEHRVGPASQALGELPGAKAKRMVIQAPITAVQSVLPSGTAPKSVIGKTPEAPPGAAKS